MKSGDARTGGQLSVQDVTHFDRATVSRILAGDRDAFQRLFDAYFPRLYRFARARLGPGDDDVREAVQQTFCRAIDRLDTYRGEAALYTWFCQILTNVINDRYRARGLDQRRFVRLDDSPQVQAILDTLRGPDTDRPDVELWRHEIRHVVQATLDRLPDRYADVLEWKYIEQVSVDEIAARLELGPKAAESLLTRARQAFREAIDTLISAEDALLPPELPGGSN